VGQHGGQAVQVGGGGADRDGNVTGPESGCLAPVEVGDQQGVALGEPEGALRE
jgi:hypothetical protein